MELNSDKMTGFLSFPIEEMKRIITVMSEAEKAADLKALQWAARLLAWLYEEASETESGDDEYYPAHLLNRAWSKQLKADPPPESVKGIFQEEAEAAHVV